MFDHPPLAVPTNVQGEAQKFLNELWITQLIQKFEPTVVFDESPVALASLAMVHRDFDFFRPTYRPQVPWVYMDVPMLTNDVAGFRGIPNSADTTYRFSLREEY